MKLSNLPINNNKNNLINCSVFIPFAGSRRNINNIYSMKKSIGFGNINSKITSKSKRLSSGINYKSICQ